MENNSIEVRAHNADVKRIWGDMRKPLQVITQHKGGDMKVCGAKYWDRPIQISASTGRWADRSLFGKPPRWLIRFNPDTGELIPENHFGYFSLRQEASIFCVRISVVLHTTMADEQNDADDDATLDVYEPIDDIEWMVIFAVSTLSPRGSSCTLGQCDQLKDGYVVFRSDQRGHRVPIGATGLIPPPMDHRSDNALLKTIHNGIVDLLSAAPLYEIYSYEDAPAFIQAVDQLNLRPVAVTGADAGTATTMSTPAHLLMASAVPTNKVLWGRDAAALNAAVASLAAVSEHEVVHIGATPDWNIRTLSHLAAQLGFGNKMVIIHGVERLNAHAALPLITMASESVPLFDEAGNRLPHLNDKPASWVLVLYHPSPESTTQLIQVLGDSVQWIHCIDDGNPQETVLRLYDNAQVARPTQMNENLFVSMWEILDIQYAMPRSVLAQIVMRALEHDPSAAWDIDGPRGCKQTLVTLLKQHLTPYWLAQQPEQRRQCFDSLITGLGIPLSDADRLMTIGV